MGSEIYPLVALIAVLHLLVAVYQGSPKGKRLRQLLFVAAIAAVTISVVVVGGGSFNALTLGIALAYMFVLLPAYLLISAGKALAGGWSLVRSRPKPGAQADGSGPGGPT